MKATERGRTREGSENKWGNAFTQKILSAQRGCDFGHQRADLLYIVLSFFGSLLQRMLIRTTIMNVASKVMQLLFLLLIYVQSAMRAFSLIPCHSSLGGLALKASVQFAQDAVIRPFLCSVMQVSRWPGRPFCCLRTILGLFFSSCGTASLLGGSFYRWPPTSNSFNPAFVPFWTLLGVRGVQHLSNVSYFRSILYVMLGWQAAGQQ